MRWKKLTYNKTEIRNEMGVEEKLHNPNINNGYFKVPHFGMISENNHQTAKRRNNNRNMECLLSTGLQKSTGAHPWVKTVLMGQPGPCRSQMDRISRNYHRWGTQDLVLQRRLETPVWGDIHGKESAALSSPANSSPSGSQWDNTTSQSWRGGGQWVLRAAW